MWLYLFKDFNLSCIYYLIMSFKDFNYMYSSFLIQRCHLHYFSRSQTRANTQTYARSLAHSLIDAHTHTHTFVQRSLAVSLPIPTAWKTGSYGRF